MIFRVLFAIGFRPFYLLASLYAGLAVLFWAHLALGGAGPGGGFNGMSWHSHDMIFGYVTAVIVGFLFTAVRNWTGRKTPDGGALAALAALWLAARLLALTPYPVLAAAVDLLFLPLAAVAVARPIIAAQNWRNLFVIAVLMVLWLCNLLLHGETLWPAAFDGTGLIAKPLAFDVLTLLMAVIGGRVIPFFSASAIPTLKPVRLMPLEIGAIGSLVLAAMLEPFRAVDGIAPVIGGVFAVAAALHGVRLLLWKPWQTRSQPLLWMLPVSYVWIPVSLGLRAAAQFDGPAEVFGFHALALGAIGGLTLAMMARSALGHTGRPLRAGRAVIAAFMLIQGAAVVRVVVPQLSADLWTPAIALAAASWSLAFLLFFARFLPILTQPRIDGRPG